MIQRIENFAPDAALLRISLDDGEVIEVSRDENGEVHVDVRDMKEGSETRFILGKPGETAHG
jgi:hypothetical protein